MMSALFGSSFAFSRDIALKQIADRRGRLLPGQGGRVVSIKVTDRSSGVAISTITISETGLTRTQAHYGYLWWVSAPDSALPQSFSAVGYRWFAVKTSTPKGTPSH